MALPSAIKSIFSRNGKKMDQDNSIMITESNFEPIPMFETVTSENFDEKRYLESNQDVATAVTNGAVASGRAHFDRFGHKEGRRQRAHSPKIEQSRRAKMRRLEPFLRHDLPHETYGDQLDFLTADLRAAMRIVSTTNVSANGYDGTVLELIAKHRDGLVLDCGAGRRDVYHPNVVNFEIVAYDTTDVIGVGEVLPFKDHTFDAVLSIAVLEHVRDPFLCAAEITRVLKPGGELICALPFLQPLHGYPHHYFNATHQGLRRLFEDTLQIDKMEIPTVNHPMFALHWILSSWSNGLPENARSNFRDLRIGDILGRSPHDLLQPDYSAQLPEETLYELACGFMLSAHKPLNGA